MYVYIYMALTWIPARDYGICCRGNDTPPCKAIDVQFHCFQRFAVKGSVNLSEHIHIVEEMTLLLAKQLMFSFTVFNVSQ